MNKVIFYILSFLFLFVACSQEEVVTHDDEDKEKERLVTLNVTIPGAPSYTQTRATEQGSDAENLITSLHVTLTVGATNLEKTFTGSELTETGFTDKGYPTIRITYPVDVTLLEGVTGIQAQVFANSSTPPAPIVGEIDFWNADKTLKPLFMSGKATINKSGDVYSGEVGLTRQVAKVRLKVSKSIDCIPLNLQILYDKIEVTMLKVANQSDPLKSIDISTTSGFDYISYNKRTGQELRMVKTNNVHDPLTVVDSCYIHENYKDNAIDYNDGNTTTLKIEIPTLDPVTNQEEILSGEYKIKGDDGYVIKRNHIYTLDIKVRSQTTPLDISLLIRPWEVKEEYYPDLEPVL